MHKFVLMSELCLIYDSSPISGRNDLGSPNVRFSSYDVKIYSSIKHKVILRPVVTDVFSLSITVKKNFITHCNLRNTFGKMSLCSKCHLKYGEPDQKKRLLLTLYLRGLDTQLLKCLALKCWAVHCPYLHFNTL